MKFWKKRNQVDKGNGKRKQRKVQDLEKMMQQYNQFLFQREMLHKKLVDQAKKLERERSRKGLVYVR